MTTRDPGRQRAGGHGTAGPCPSRRCARLHRRCTRAGGLRTPCQVAADGRVRVPTDIATHPRIFREPTRLDEALAFVDGLLAQPGVEMATATVEWPRLRELCVRHSLVGNRVPDAWIAVNVARLDEALVTFDRGFGRLLDAHRIMLLTAVH